jgi:hypothetical protein
VLKFGIEEERGERASAEDWLEMGTAIMLLALCTVLQVE